MMSEGGSIATFAAGLPYILSVVLGVLPGHSKFISLRHIYVIADVGNSFVCGEIDVNRYV